MVCAHAQSHPARVYGELHTAGVIRACLHRMQFARQQQQLALWNDLASGFSTICSVLFRFMQNVIFCGINRYSIHQYDVQTFCHTHYAYTSHYDFRFPLRTMRKSTRYSSFHLFPYAIPTIICMSHVVPVLSGFTVVVLKLTTNFTQIWLVKFIAI